MSLFAIQQKLAQHCKSTTLQLKKKRTKQQQKNLTGHLNL